MHNEVPRKEPNGSFSYRQEKAEIDQNGMVNVPQTRVLGIFVTRTLSWLTQNTRDRSERMYHLDRSLWEEESLDGQLRPSLLMAHSPWPDHCVVTRKCVCMLLVFLALMVAPTHLIFD